jgi:hypothetical protein
MILLEIDILSLLLLFTSIYFLFKIKGKDTKLMNLLFMLISFIILLSATLIYPLITKYFFGFEEYAIVSDIVIFAIAISMTVMTYRTYKEYYALVKKHDTK